MEEVTTKMTEQEEFEFRARLEAEQASEPVVRRTPLQMIPPEPSGWDKYVFDPARSFKRQLGLTARAGIQGATALPAMVANVPAMAYNKAADIFSPGGFRFPEQSQAVSNALTRMGLPIAETPIERISQDIAGSMAGAGGMMGMAGQGVKAAISPAVINAMRTMTQAPTAQMLAAGAGGAGSGVTREMGGGPTAQTVAGLAASLAAPAVPEVAKMAIRGGEGARAVAGKRLPQFENAGVTPSVSQAFPSHGPQAYESFLFRGPGSHGIMRDFAETQAEKMGARVTEIADILSGKASPMIAGRAIEEGITGQGGFLDHFKGVSKKLYDRLDSFIPSASPAKVTNTVGMLHSLTSATPGAEETSRLLINSKVLQIGEALAADLGGKSGKTISILGPNGKPISSVTVGGKTPSDSLPYGALKELRSRVGEMLSNSELISDIPRRQLKQLYASISSDMGEAVKATGNPEAWNVFRRANAYTKAGHDRIDNVLQPIINRDAPEKIFQAALQGSKEGDTTIRSVMQSLPSDSQKVLAATVIKRLGKALPSQQSAEGDVFSVNRFLTNWNLMSLETKRSLFSRYGASFTKDLDNIAKTADNIISAGKSYANPSGTAPALTLQHTAGGFMIALLTGHPGVAGAIAGEVGIADLSARAFTNPKFVKWLAQSSKTPGILISAALNQLSQIGNRSNDPVLVELANIGQNAIKQQ